MPKHAIWRDGRCITKNVSHMQHKLTVSGVQAWYMAANMHTIIALSNLIEAFSADLRFLTKGRPYFERKIRLLVLQVTCWHSQLTSKVSATTHKCKEALQHSHTYSLHAVTVRLRSPNRWPSLAQQYCTVRAGISKQINLQNSIDAPACGRGAYYNILVARTTSYSSHSKQHDGRLLVLRQRAFNARCVWYFG